MTDAFDRHMVLVFPDQDLSAEALLAVAERFGTPYRAPKGVPMLGGLDQPPVVAVSNVTEDGLLGADALPPHTDQQYTPDPPRITMLWAAEVPDSGGDTLFGSLCDAYDLLTKEEQALAERLQVWSKSLYSAADDDARALLGPNQMYVEGDVPVFPHPLVWTHPTTGRRSLYASPLSTGLIDPDGVDRTEFLKRIKEIMWNQVPYYRHRWRPGDLVMWDNQYSIHRRDAFEPTARRVMYRVQVRELNAVPA